MRLGPLGLCTIDHAQLVCAPVSAAPPVIGEPARLGPLPIEPESLAFLTEAGPTPTGAAPTMRVEACGRGPQGLLCAASGGPLALWSSAFAHECPATASDRSLAGFTASSAGSTSAA